MAEPVHDPDELTPLDEQIAACEREVAVCDALILATYDRRAKKQAQIVQFRRIRAFAAIGQAHLTVTEEPEEAPTPAAWWDTVLIEDLVAGDVIRFELDDVAAVNRNGDGRYVLRSGVGVGIYDGDCAVRVRFPRPVATKVTAPDVVGGHRTVAAGDVPPAGIEMVPIGDPDAAFDVADVHDLVERAVAR